MTRAIVTVGINPARGFGPYHERFDRTFKEHGCADHIIQWKHGWPPNSPSHTECHYAFKVYALLDLIQKGFTSLLWCDVSCYAVKDIEPLWQVIEKQGYFLCGEPALDHGTGFVRDPSITMDRLGEWSSDRALAAFNLLRDDAMKVTLLSGTCIGISTKNAFVNSPRGTSEVTSRGRMFLNELQKYAEQPGHYNGTHASGLFGPPNLPEGKQVSRDLRVKGHRSDEVYCTLIARQLKMISSGEYFTGGNEERSTTVIKSGYNL